MCVGFTLGIEVLRTSSNRQTGERKFPGSKSRSSVSKKDIIVRP